MHKNLRSFLQVLQQEKEIIEIDAPVDPVLELAEIQRRIVAEQGPALIFRQVKGSKFPVVTNLYGTMRRLDLALGPKPEAIIRQAIAAFDRLLPPKLGALWQERDWILPLTKLGLRAISNSRAPILECCQEGKQVDLNQIPALVSWPEDGGRFLTLPLVYTQHPETGQHNLGMYRVQFYTENQTGMHWQIHKGGGFHHYAAEQKGVALPATVFLGGPPVLALAALAALPEMLPELLFASFLMGDKLDMTQVPGQLYPLIAEAEFALCGEVPSGVRQPEGPFGDHYGYYSLKHDFPVFNVQRLYHRRDAIYPATVVGKPRQEDYYLGDYFQSMLTPIFPMLMPGVKDLWTYAESGFHSLTAAVVRESYTREAFAHACRILGEGQLSLTKFLILTDVPCNLRDFPQLFTQVLERFNPASDLFILNDIAADTLDYTGRKFNRGSKAVMLGLGASKRKLPASYQGGALAEIQQVRPYCAGCLLVAGPSFSQNPDLASILLQQNSEDLAPWPLVILLDELDSIQDQTAFLWTVFTRFDPGWDLYAEKTVQRNQLVYQGPILIDARMKPEYPGELIPDPATVDLVSKRWAEYFG